MRYTFVLLAALVAASLLTVSPTLADDVDPTGARLKGVVEDYLAKAPENDADANKLREAGGVSATASAQNWNVHPLLCTIEGGLTTIGGIIWKDRLKNDECGSALSGLSTYQYCVGYSNACGHWVWDAGCLKKKGCDPHW